MTCLEKYTLLALSAVALASCSGGTEPGGGGGGSSTPVIINISGATPSLGAVQFVVAPPPSGSVPTPTFAAGYTHYQKTLTGGAVRFILIGDFINGELLRFTVPAGVSATGFSLSVEAGADENTYALIPGASLGITLEVQSKGP